MQDLPAKERFFRIINRHIRTVDFQNKPIDYSKISDRDLVLMVFANWKREQEQHITDVGE